MSLCCPNCGSVNPCNCPSPEEIERRRKKREQQRRQEAHEASIKRQKSKMKKVPWRTDKNRGDYIGE